MHSLRRPLWLKTAIKYITLHRTTHAVSLVYIYSIYIYVCVCIYIICILKTPFEEKHWDFSDRRTLSLWNELSFFQTARVIFTQVKYDVKALVYVYDTYGQYCINTG